MTEWVIMTFYMATGEPLSVFARGAGSSEKAQPYKTRKAAEADMALAKSNQWDRHSQPQVITATEYERMRQAWAVARELFG